MHEQSGVMVESAGGREWNFIPVMILLSAAFSETTSHTLPTPITYDNKHLCVVRVVSRLIPQIHKCRICRIGDAYPAPVTPRQDVVVLPDLTPPNIRC